MNGPQAKKVIEQNGYVLDRIKGSQHIFVKNGCLDVTIPIHGKKELKLKTEISIFKSAGLYDMWKDMRRGKK